MHPRYVTLFFLRTSRALQLNASQYYTGKAVDVLDQANFFSFLSLDRKKKGLVQFKSLDTTPLIE